MSYLQLAKDFLKHRLGAKTRHGVHSPFVYQLVDKTIYDFRAKESYKEIENLRAKLKKDERELQITDLGAGSKFNSHPKKKLKTIARNALKAPKLAQLIHRLSSERKPRLIIELGTCLGLTTAYLSKAAPEAKIISMEGCPETAAVAQENLTQLGATNVDLRIGHFDQLLPEALKDIDQLDLLFIDGNHTYEATMRYFQLALEKVHEQSLIIFDDIYWSEGMKRAWKEICEHPRVTVTVDLFWIGLVYFHQGQAKEHFRIKY